MDQELILWYPQEAQDWESQALPLGDGRLGMMAFGGIREDRYVFSENSLWYGSRRKEAPRDRSGTLKQVRAMLFEGKSAQAQEIAQEALMGDPPAAGHQVLGELALQFDNAQPDQGYRRQLNLRQGLHEVSFDGQRRRAFLSAADRVAVLEWAATNSKTLSGTILLSRQANAQTRTENDGRLILTGQARSDGHEGGTRFEFQVLAQAEGGSVKAQNDCLRFEGVRTLRLLADVVTDFPSGLPVDSAGLSKHLADTANMDTKQLLDRHLDLHQNMMDRVMLDLGPAPELPTDQRLKKYQEGGKDPALEALYFQYGRYLLLASSRDTRLPANLQGVWNKDLAAPWNADYHVNINLQMNYWHAEATALPECHLPLFAWLADTAGGAARLPQSLGLKGRAFGYTSDAWGWSGLEGRTQWGLWVTGLAWCSRHLMEHYRYSGDVEFLKRQAWPLLRDNAEFLLDWLVEDPATGKLVSGPATSPENEYLDQGGNKINICMGPSMDQEIIHESLSHLVETAALLGEKDPLVERAGAALKRLALPGIASDGRLMEWPQEYKEAEPGHRHLSHIYGLHPGHRLTGQDDLLKAARKTMQERLKHGGGHTGWSRAWIVNFYARLGDGGEAYRHFRLLLEKSTLPNLFDTHPPFQIDGNFGGTAGLAEMLLKNRIEGPHLLPALPSAWANGKVKGLRSWNGLNLDLEWKAGALSVATLHATLDFEGRVDCQGRQWNVSLKAGESRTLN